jgi:MFS family permease
MAIGSVLPVLPLYVKGPIGAGDVAVGVVVGAFAITAAIGRPLGGRLADATSRRRVLIIGLLTASAGGAMLFLPLGVPGLVFARLVVGFGDGWIFTAGVSWIVDLTPEERRGQVIGIFGISVWGGIAIGTVVGQALYSVAGYDWVWAFATVAPLVGLLVASRIPSTVRRSSFPSMPEEVASAEMGVPLPERSAGEPVTSPAGRRRSWLPTSAVRPGIALLFANVGFGTLAGFIVLLLDGEGIGHGAAAFTVFTATVVASRLLFGWLPDRWGARRSALAGGIAQAAGIATIGLAGSLPMVMVGAVLAGTGIALIFPSLALLVVNATDPAARATAMGWFTSFFDIGVAVGAPFAGLIASTGGGGNYQAAFFAAAVVCLAGAFIGFLGTRNQPRSVAVA